VFVLKCNLTDKFFCSQEKGAMLLITPSTMHPSFDTISPAANILACG